MSSLQELCSGLPLRPLPENRGRWAGVPHAPVRTPDLSPAEEQVTTVTQSSGALWCLLDGQGVWVPLLSTPQLPTLSPPAPREG